MIDDPQDRCKDISGTFGPFEYEFSVTSAEDLDYAMLLVEQALALDKRR
jgi:predicted transport protein